MWVGLGGWGLGLKGEHRGVGGALWGMIGSNQHVFENEHGFTDSNKLRVGFGGGRHVNIIRLHDVEMYQTVDFMSACTLQGSG